MEDEVLFLQVSDDGPGIADNPRSNKGSGLGITNTRRRLEQLYGDESSLEFGANVPRGTVVRISLPAHTIPVMNGEGDL